MVLNQYIDQIKDAAKIVFKDNIVLQHLCIAQAILESRLLGTPSELAVLYNNYFGIKKPGTMGLINLPTTEIINNKAIRMPAYFGYNKSIVDSVKQYRQVLELPRYQSLWSAKTFQEAARIVRECGYCTDLNYTKKLIQLEPYTN